MSTRIERLAFIQDTSEIVYRALTEAPEPVHWFCDRATVDAREGGELVACWKGKGKGNRGHAVFEALIPNKTVRVCWTNVGPRHSSAYSIRASATSTEVSMVYEGGLSLTKR